MSIIRFVLLITLSFNLLGCRRPTSNTERAKGLMAEANNLLAADVGVSEKWVREYGSAFTPANRAQFPSNRESLRSRGETMVRLLNESTKLNAEAAEKFEQAAGLVDGGNEKKGLDAFAASIRKNIEINGLFKEQLLLASDAEIKDQKIFNEKFMTLMSLIQLKSKERDERQTEGKKLLGL